MPAAARHDGARFREAVVALVRSRDVWVPGPRTSTGQIVAGGSQRGEARVVWFECPRCAGRKSIGQGRAIRQCDRCEGAGRVKGDAYTFGRERSSVAVVRERVTGEAEGRLLERRERDRELRRLRLAELHREGLIDGGEREHWEAAKRALWAEGSYAELEVALHVLRGRSEYDYAAVLVRWGYDSELREIGVELRRRSDVALTRLCSLMPGEVRVPEWALEKDERGKGRWANGYAQSVRDERVRQWAREGVSGSEIARRIGVDRSTVCRILGKENGEEAA